MAASKTTIYICFRPFEGEWIDRNQTVLNSLAWQNVDNLVVKFVHWSTEVETKEFANLNRYPLLEIPWFNHYLFEGNLRSFKLMFEAILNDCDTQNFVYINGDIVLGPGVLNWLEKNMQSKTMYSLPRHNWNFTNELKDLPSYQKAFSETTPEAWTALDLFACKTEDARNDMVPVPPFILTAGSMDSWIVIRAGESGWNRRLIPPDKFSMLHIEHPASHPFKSGALPEKFGKWAFNCGVFEAAVQNSPIEYKRDASLKCFIEAEKFEAVEDEYTVNSSPKR